MWSMNRRLAIKTLSKNSKHFPKKIQGVEWLPAKQLLTFERNENGLIVSLPGKKLMN